MFVRGSFPDRFLDVYYDDLLCNPMQTIKHIYNFLGLILTPQIEQAMVNSLSENRQHKYGVHKYCLQDFGLSPEGIRRELQFYFSKFFNGKVAER